MIGASKRVIVTSPKASMPPPIALIHMNDEDDIENKGPVPPGVSRDVYFSQRFTKVMTTNFFSGNIPLNSRVFFCLFRLQESTLVCITCDRRLHLVSIAPRLDLWTKPCMCLCVVHTESFMDFHAALQSFMHDAWHMTRTVKTYTSARWLHTYVKLLFGSENVLPIFQLVSHILMRNAFILSACIQTNTRTLTWTVPGKNKMYIHAYWFFPEGNSRTYAKKKKLEYVRPRYPFRWDILSGSYRCTCVIDIRVRVTHEQAPYGNDMHIYVNSLACT